MANVINQWSNKLVGKTKKGVVKKNLTKKVNLCINCGIYKQKKDGYCLKCYKTVEKWYQWKKKNR